jgi:hypothetical protein
MHAKPGDRIIIKGHRLGEPDRDGEVLEARGKGGGSPFLVRWGETGHVGLLYPGSDAVVQELGAGRDHARRSRKGASS